MLQKFGLRVPPSTSVAIVVLGVGTIPDKSAQKSLDRLTVEGHFQRKPIYNDWNKNLLLQMYRHQQRVTKIKNNQANMILLERQNKVQVVDHKEMGDV